MQHPCVLGRGCPALYSHPPALAASKGKSTCLLLSLVTSLRAGSGSAGMWPPPASDMRTRGHSWQKTSGATWDPSPHRTGKTKPELTYIQISKLLPSPDHNFLHKNRRYPLPLTFVRLLYRRAVTQRCSSGALSAPAGSCSPQSLKRSAQTPTWQTDATWLLRHRHSFWLCCTSMGGQGSSSRQSCQPALSQVLV